MPSAKLASAPLASAPLASAPLASALWPATGSAALVRNAALALAGSLLLWLSAKIQVPFWPVPMTMQTYAIMVIGAAYGWRLAGATVLLYLAQGFAGLPVFAGAAAGPAYFAGPTAGYLVGFVVSAVFIGWVAERGWARSLPRMAVAMTVGHLLILGLGVAWLSTLVGVEKAVAVGLTPFWAATALKTALAAATLPLAWRAVDTARAAG